MRRNLWWVIVAAQLAVTLAACGDDGGEKVSPAGREVSVSMKGLKYDPASVKVEHGETVTFVFTNDDTIRHDAFIGDEAAQDDHESDMASDASDHASDHEMDAADAIVVEPGKTGEITHTFDHGGTILIGCHEPGHYAGGMKLTITVG